MSFFFKRMVLGPVYSFFAVKSDVKGYRKQNKVTFRLPISGELLALLVQLLAMCVSHLMRLYCLNWLFTLFSFVHLGFWN